MANTRRRAASSKATGTRKSRTQEELEHDLSHIEFDSALFDQEGSLPEIPKREGYEQRWVRVQMGGRTDARNLSTRARLGWVPRPADTVGGEYQSMVVQNETMGGIIGTHDCVLMERPMAFHQKAKQIKRQRVHDLETAVRRNIFREHNQLGGADSGFTAPRDESKARLERGVPRVLDDD
jgi:hypothetical protein